MTLIDRSVLQKRNQQLFEHMINANSLKPTFTVAKLIALMIALIIHGITLSFAVGTLYFLVAMLGALAHHYTGYAFVLFIVTLLLGALTWGLRPRVNRVPKQILSRTDFPTLYWFTDTIAGLLNARYIDGVIISSLYTANYGRYGFKQKTLLHIGMPLWTTLNDQEKVALVAHEIAHFVNGDFSHNFIVGSAFRSLKVWYEILSAVAKAPSFLPIFLVPISLLCRLGLTLTLRLMFHESRRAEYLADLLAAQVSGTESVISLLTKLQFQLDYEPYLLSMRCAKIDPYTLFEGFRGYIQERLANPTSLAELDRKTKIYDEIYSETHPPTAYRKQFLESHRIANAQFVLTSDASMHLLAELANVERAFQVHLMADL